MTDLCEMCSQDRWSACVCAWVKEIYKDGELDNLCEELNKENSRLKNAVADIEHEGKLAIDECESLRRENSQIRADYAELESRFVKYKDFDAEYATTLQIYRDEIESLRARIAELEAETDECHKIMATYARALDENRNDLQIERDLYTSAINRLEAEIARREQESQQRIDCMDICHVCNRETLNECCCKPKPQPTKQEAAWSKYISELEAFRAKYKDVDAEYAMKLHECQDTIEDLLRENETLRRENGELRDSLLYFKKAHLKEENRNNA